MCCGIVGRRSAFGQERNLQGSSESRRGTIRRTEWLGESWQVTSGNRGRHARKHGRFDTGGAGASTRDDVISIVPQSSLEFLSDHDASSSRAVVAIAIAMCSKTSAPSHSLECTRAIWASDDVAPPAAQGGQAPSARSLRGASRTHGRAPSSEWTSEIASGTELPCFPEFNRVARLELLVEDLDVLDLLIE